MGDAVHLVLARARSRSTASARESSWATVIPGRIASRTTGMSAAYCVEERALASVGLAQHEGPGQVRAVAVDHRRQVDDDEVAGPHRSRALPAWSMQVSRPTLSRSACWSVRPRPHHGVCHLGRDVMAGRAVRPAGCGPIHPDPRDALGRGHRRDLRGLLHPTQRSMIGSDERAPRRGSPSGTSRPGRRRVEPLLHGDAKTASRGSGAARVSAVISRRR